MSTLQFKRSLTAVAVAAAFAGGAFAADHYGTASGAHAAIPVVAPQAAVGTAPVAALPDFADLVARHGPAVVEVSTQTLAHRTASRRDAPDLDGLPPWFRQLIPNMPDQPNQGPMRGLGSGFVVDPNGVILTNAHVVDGADEVTVKFTNQREYTAKVLGVDKATDVAVLKVDARDLPTVAIGDPNKARVGEWVVAIGAPFGLENTVTSGIISAKSRSLPGDSIVPFIQTDAAVNPGNSGGPLFDLKGEVIGINSQIYSRSGGYQGLAFAIPIDVAMNVEQQIVAHGKVTHGKLGVTVQEVTQALANDFGMKGPAGALVGTVEKGGPGDKAGIEPGDVITSFEGHPIARSADLPPLVASANPGKAVTLEVWRDGKARTLTATLGSLATEKVAMNGGSHEVGGKLGVSVRPLSPDEKAAASLDHGVVVEDVGGAAADAGVQPGDVILAVNRSPVTSPSQLKALIGKAGKTVALLVQRDDARIFIPVKIG
ncbi:MAG TPA: DegQ family serine endoprotease [Casimicrobiaceae bacterium]|jgi:serine protease Do